MAAKQYTVMFGQTM